MAADVHFQTDYPREANSTQFMTAMPKKQIGVAGQTVIQIQNDSDAHRCGFVALTGRAECMNAS
jgi:hypothetical protein